MLGDKALKDELLKEDGMPWVKFVETKEALGKFSSKLKSMARIKNETIDAVKAVIDSPYMNIPIYQVILRLRWSLLMRNTSLHLSLRRTYPGA